MSTTHLIHPGVILHEEFLEPLGISSYRLAQDIGVDKTRIYAIIRGQRDVTADTAIRLARYFDTTEAFWMNLQTTYDLSKEHADHEEELQAIKPLTPA
ncbi:HigA family addiction module antitoxin [Nesterenkonia sp. F]|uniref:HigA family addiction module antitoxin n=1 Tax=Nesterenkonia sp. F TaxID=795955 RepID=UPI000255D5A6|nr:HigA family addiction module antitoxin [Nesterenkonia sp. F]